MEKRPVKIDLVEWMILTDLIKARPKKYQDKDHKGSDVYDLSKLAEDCGKPIWDVGPTERARRVSLVTKLEEWSKDGYRSIEFKPFEDREDSID
jgi:hypothetical protein